MKRFLFYILGLVLFIGCVEEPEPAPPPYTQEQRDQILDFIHDASLLNEQTLRGINLIQFTESISSLAASWDRIRRTDWPDNFHDEEDAINAMIGAWHLTQRYWRDLPDHDSRYHQSRRHIARFLERYRPEAIERFEGMQQYRNYYMDDLRNYYMNLGGEIFEHTQEMIYNTFR